MLNIVMLGLSLLPIDGVRAQPNKEPTDADRVREMVAKLGKPITLEKGIDANTPLKDAMDFLADRYDFSLVIDETAFRSLGVNELENQPVRFPKAVGLKLGTVLRMVLAQVNAGILVTPDHIEVMPLTPPALPPVCTVFDKRPLDQALRDLSELADVTVLLDTNRAAELAQAPVTASLKKVPVDTAVRLLADMAGLKMVQVEKVLYVTTRENADGLHKELQRENPKAAPAPGM